MEQRVYQKRITMRPHKNNITLMSRHAEAWGRAYWYTDGLRVTVCYREMPLLADLLVLHTKGDLSAESIAEMVRADLGIEHRGNG